MHILNNKLKGVFNVGANNEIDNISIVNTIGEMIGIKESERYVFINDRAGHDQRYSIDPESTNSIGWFPKVDFSIGIKKTIKYYEGKWK